MQLKVVYHRTNRKTTENGCIFQFLISPLIYEVEKQNLYFLSFYDNVLKYTVKYPIH